MGCDGISLTQKRPILEKPDANQDRIKKEILTGTTDKPKYWISKVTMIRATFDQGFSGWQSRAQAGYFEFKRDKLRFYNVMTRQFLEKPEVASQGVPELIYEWDIEHSEFRLREVDGYTINQEEENEYLPWRQKNFFTIQWNSLKINVANSSCWKPETPSVIDSSREITNDYISFVLSINFNYSYDKKRCNNYYQKTRTVEYRYSFKKIADPRSKDSNYKPYVYDGEDDPLFNKYGYFKTVRKSIAKNNRDKNIFYANRWNPNKKHIFYFGENYPKAYKFLAHGVICASNKLFANHGLNDYPKDGKCKEDGSVLPAKNETCSTGICFELRENTGQKMGDIRYSFFHILNPDQYYYLGYGPSDAHPATGEIISGNIYINFALLETYIDYYVNNPLKRELVVWTNPDGSWTENPHGATKYDTSSLFSYMKNLLEEEDPKKWTESSKRLSKDSSIRPDFEHLVQRLTHGDPRWSEWTRSSKTNNLDNPVFDILTDILQKMIAPIQKDKQHFNKLNVKELEELTDKNYQNPFDRINLKALFPYHGDDNHLTTIYPIEPLVAQIPSLLADGRTVEEVKRIILFNLFSHEFGHVLNLRHNFYGSFDARHWHPELESSSIMDYTHIRKKSEGPPKAFFGPYDTAALVYAYSNGEIDLSKKNQTQYLFCTDQHVRLNFLCNPWDYGQTPSEVMMSLIENYEELYWTRNFRLDRDYWDTRRYPFYILKTMMDIKQALLMWQTTFNQNNIYMELDKSTNDYTQSDKAEIFNNIQKDIKQAIKLSMAFYDAVILIPESDRNWKNKYNNKGEIERIGILFDKYFALLFLMGDYSFNYNPNEPLYKASYMTYINQLGFSEMIEKIMENTLTLRVDMTPWFIYLGRWLYAKSASNFYSKSEGLALLEKIAVRCYTPDSLKNQLGIDPPDNNTAKIVSIENSLDQIKDTYYKGLNEKLGIANRDGKYYVASNLLNKYSFVLFEQLSRSELPLKISPELMLDDIHEMFLVYNWFKNENRSPACQ